MPQFKICSTDHNEILHKSRQLHCRDMRKILLWSVEYIINQSTANCGRISNLIEISLVGQAPGPHFTNDLCPHNQNLVKTYIALTWKTKIWSEHNIAHAMTAELSWHVQNCVLIESLNSKLKQIKLREDNFYKLINHLWNGPLIT